MYQVIVESTRIITHPDSPEWTSPEWVRIWQIGRLERARKRARTLRFNKNYRVTILKVTRNGTEVVDG